MNKPILLLLLIFLFLSCQKDDLFIIDDEFENYVDEFFNEAQLRGLDLHKDDFNFSVVMRDITGDAAGRCNSLTNRITIDGENWRRNENERELIIFHELGHCILGLKHNSAESKSGECLSYMRTIRKDETVCSINFTSSLWKKHYLDVLFGIEKEFPEWRISEGEVFVEEINQRVIFDSLVNVQAFRNFDGKFDNTDLGEEYIIEVEWENNDPAIGSISFTWDNIVFQSCNTCQTVRSTRIYKYFGEGEMYAGNIKDASSLIILTLKKKASLYYFYLNSKLIHVMDPSASFEVGNISEDNLLTVPLARKPRKINVKLSTY